MIIPVDVLMSLVEIHLEEIAQNKQLVSACWPRRPAIGAWPAESRGRSGCNSPSTRNYRREAAAQAEAALNKAK